MNVRRPDEGGSTTSELPLLHRAAVAYLVLPLVVWLVGWFRWEVGVPLALLLAAGLRRALAGGWRVSKPSRASVAVLLAAAAWIATTPAFGLFQGHSDWIIHRAVLLDLVWGEWPTYLAGYVDNPPLLRYYLGWYMVPALTGRWLGAWALNWAAPLWTWCGISLALLLFARGLRTTGAALAGASVLILFGGMDVAEHALREGVPETTSRLLGAPDRDSTEVVRPFGFVRAGDSPMMLDYQSNHMTLLATPQHFIPGAVAALLILQAGGRRRFLAVLGIVLAACVFWSTLLSTGLLPLAAAAALRRGRIRSLLTWQNTVLAVALAGVLALYLTSGDVDYPRGWLWSLYDSKLRMTADLLFLYASEFLVLVFLLWRLDPDVVRQPIFVASVGVLLVMPWFHYGGTRFDEWGIRFVVPSLVVVSSFTARALVAGWPRGPAGRRPRAAFGALLAVLGVGVLTWVVDAGPAIAHPQWRLPFERAEASLLVDGSSRGVRQRTSVAVPELLDAVLRKSGVSAPPGRLLIRSAYDVYLENDRLVYVKQNCLPEDHADFFLEVHPQDAKALPADLQRVGYETLHFRLEPWEHLKRGACIVPSRPFGYAAARITTGQFVSGEGRIWEAEAAIGRP